MVVPVSISVRACMGERCPPDVILWSLMCFQAYVRRGCGIQRTPGDKVTVEEKSKKDTPGCGFIEGGVLSSVLYGMQVNSFYKMLKNVSCEYDRVNG